MKVMNFRQLLFWWFLSLLVSKSSSVRECLKSGFSKYKVSWQKVPRSTSGLLWEKYISKFAVQKRNQALSPAQFGQDGCSRRPTGVPVHDIQTLFFSKIYILLCFVFSSNLRHLSAYTVSGVVGESGAPESGVLTKLRNEELCFRELFLDWIIRRLFLDYSWLN